MRIWQRSVLGVSLVELMVVLAVISVLAFFSTPFISSTVGNNRIDSGADQLAASFRYARSEAISSGVITSVCSSNNGATCTATEWAQGWIVYRNTANGTDVLQAVTPARQVNISNTAAEVSFDPLGKVISPAGTSLTFTVANSGSTLQRDILVSQIGKISTQ